MLYLTIFTALYLFGSLAYFGRLKPEYSHVKYTISELAESGSVTEKQVSFLVFLPIGIVMGWIAYQVQVNEIAMLFALSLSVGYGLSAFFPIDQDAPFTGSWNNDLHNLAAALSYGLAIMAFEEAASVLELPFEYGKYLVMALIISIYIPGLRNLRGLLQRITEFAIFGGIIWAQWPN